MKKQKERSRVEGSGGRLDLSDEKHLKRAVTGAVGANDASKFFLRVDLLFPGSVGRPIWRGPIGNEGESISCPTSVKKLLVEWTGPSINWI